MIKVKETRQKIRSVISSLQCTHCKAIQPLTKLKYGRITWQLCQNCLADLDQPGFDWDQWTVIK
jgi:hypothetical protein